MSYALVTGASGGIGLELARQLAQRRYDVLLVARSEEKLLRHSQELNKKYGIEAAYKALDLTADGADRKVVEWVTERDKPLEILVNNAGYGLWGPLEKTPYSDTRNMMKLNMDVPVSLCTQLIPLLKKSPQAYILNVASTTAYQAVPFLSVYAATKAFIVLFSRGLRWELKDASISVSCLSPGATATDFTERAHIVGELKKKAERVAMSPEQVARIGIKGMMDKKAEIIPGLLNRVSAGAAELFPKYIAEKVAYGLYGKTNT